MAVETFSPRDEADVAEVVRAALANGRPIDIRGGGSRTGLGRPSQANAVLSTERLTGVTLYEPSELVLTARAGTPIEEIAALLDQRGQELAFEPMDHAALYGTPDARATIGGMVAANASGSRRIRAGAARDHILGFRAVSGRGEVFKSGGRVMKNVTGYDMSKLMAGAFGTLGLLTEVTVKVLPRAETEVTIVAFGMDDAAAVRCMTRVSGLSLEVSSFAHLPGAALLARAGIEHTSANRPATCLRLEGPEVSVKERRASLIAEIKGEAPEIITLDREESRQLWRAVRNCAVLVGPDDVVWRISTTPSEGAAVVADLKASGVPVSTHYYDWAGGLVWLAVAPAHGSRAQDIRRAVDKRGGHATLIRAEPDVRTSVPVFHPQPAALASLTARVRRSLDPELILNRGRMREDL